MFQTLVVVDDFLDFIDELREKALSAQYPIPEESTYFPGRNSKGKYLIEGVDRIVSNIVGESLAPSKGTSHGKFRVALQGERGTGGVHIDSCQWSGILYLAKDEDCKGGTDFYRHKILNTDRAPLNRKELKKMGIGSFESFWRDYLLKDSKDSSKWELTTHIPMKYNRLVLFRPWLFHEGSTPFLRTV